MDRNGRPKRAGATLSRMKPRCERSPDRSRASKHGPSEGLKWQELAVEAQWRRGYHFDFWRSIWILQALAFPIFAYRNETLAVARGVSHTSFSKSSRPRGTHRHRIFLKLGRAAGVVVGDHCAGRMAVPDGGFFTVYKGAREGWLG